ncbi:MAG TPA: glycosyltransferase family 4 protein [Acidimicrobiales bacterium]|nr:glycosyltransferase family 4 protein [Acidimicrobiales bacterium]
MRVPPLAYGGTETVIDVLARGLQRAGHEVLLFASGDSTSEVPRASVIPVAPGIDAGSALEVEHVTHAYAALAGMDVVHDHSTLGPLLHGVRGAPPTVTTNHNPFVEPFLSVYRLLQGTVPVIAISEHHRRSAAPLEIAAVIHHGLFPEEFPVGDGDGGYALFLGRMTPDKGAHRALELAHRAGIRLLLAGKQHTDLERRYFAESVVPLLDSERRYLGEVNQEDKLELLTGARCLLNPIAWPEPFGMVMIEALACGTPVITTGHGASAEIVDDGTTGFVVDDADGLLKALRKVEAIDRGACRAAVEGHFSAERMVAEHVALYERVRAEAGR